MPPPGRIPAGASHRRPRGCERLTDGLERVRTDQDPARSLAPEHRVERQQLGARGLISRVEFQRPAVGIDGELHVQVAGLICAAA